MFKAEIKKHKNIFYCKVRILNKYFSTNSFFFMITYRRGVTDGLSNKQTEQQMARVTDGLSNRWTE